MATYMKITGLPADSKPFSGRVWSAPGSPLRALQLDEESVTRLYRLAMYPPFLTEENARVMMGDVFACRGSGGSLRVMHGAMSDVEFQVPKRDWMIAMKKALNAAAEQRAWVVFLDHFEYAVAREAAGMAKRIDEVWHNAYETREAEYEVNVIKGEVGDMIANVNRVMSIIPETGYRMGGSGVFESVFTPEGIGAIEQARKTPVSEAGECINNARKFLGEGEYRLAITEAIRAVECFTKKWGGRDDFRSGVPKLRKIGMLPNESSVNMLTAFWDYANKNARHPSDNPPPDRETAELFVVTCAAYVNYMTARGPGKSAWNGRTAGLTTWERILRSDGN